MTRIRMRARKFRFSAPKSKHCPLVRQVSAASGSHEPGRFASRPSGFDPCAKGTVLAGYCLNLVPATAVDNSIPIPPNFAGASSATRLGQNRAQVGEYGVLHSPGADASQQSKFGNCSGDVARTHGPPFELDEWTVRFGEQPIGW
jgi:hypothetical protein